MFWGTTCMRSLNSMGMVYWRWWWWLAKQTWRGSTVWVLHTKLSAGAWFWQMTCVGGFVPMGQDSMQWGIVDWWWWWLAKCAWRGGGGRGNLGPLHKTECWASVLMNNVHWRLWFNGGEHHVVGYGGLIVVIVVGWVHMKEGKEGEQLGSTAQEWSHVAHFGLTIDLEWSTSEDRGLLGWRYTVEGCGLLVELVHSGMGWWYSSGICSLLPIISLFPTPPIPPLPTP